MAQVKELIAEARGLIENLDVEAFAARTPGATLIDLREPHEVEATGTIPGALNIPRGMLEFNADPATPYYNEALDNARPVLLYCASGGRSALAGAALKRLGYRAVAHLDGGIKAWTAAGKPVAR